jgi:two-component system response regulator YesN
MTLRVVLVDDEPIFREGLAADVPWAELGMELVGLAEDGEQALEIIGQQHPDLIITDVRMPFVDGLELVARTQVFLPEAVFVIISGHDEFQYAQRALRLGVKEYVLKPIDLDQLQSTLRKIGAEYENRKNERDEARRLEEAVRQSKPLLRESFFKDLISRQIDSRMIRSRLDEFGYQPRQRLWVAAIVSLDTHINTDRTEFEASYCGLDWSLYSLLKELTAGEETTVAFSTAEDECVLCFSSSNEIKLKKKVSGVFKLIHERAAWEIGCTASMAIGSMVDSAEKLWRSHDQALQALRWRYLLGRDREIWYVDIPVDDRTGQVSLRHLDGAFFTDITIGNWHAVEEAIGALIQDMREQGEQASACIQIVVATLFAEIRKILEDLGIMAEKSSELAFQGYQKILKQPTIEDTKKELLVFLANAMKMIEKQRLGRFKLVIEGAKKYIQTHFKDNKLSLEQVARAVAMSPCYLSAIFKPESGQTLREYITSLRLKRAKELLEVTAYRVGEVGYAVGFNNPTYFSTIFKKYFGISPAEYREANAIPKIKNIKEI